MSNLLHRHLPRLSAEHYGGRAVIHWVLSIADRKTGWLDDLAHAQIRELLLHACTRHVLLCPAYCFMPDHMHLLLMGTTAVSEQRGAMTLFRRHLNAVLASKTLALQKQAYDHVLREHEREHNAFEKVAWYILENPVRAGLVEGRREWRYSGCMVPGCPGWNVFDECHWLRFWKEYTRCCTGEEQKSHAIPGAATKKEAENESECSRA
jgi:REP element-mobilizing transposase RayT